jgi:anhydro-N-acetylmuramic acid kinase
MTEIYIGLMSGTSLDGIDAALIDFSDGKIKLLEFCYQPYTADFRQQIHQLSQPHQPIFLTEIGEMDAQLGHIFANTVMTLINKAKLASSEIIAIGSHGQTIYHAPEGPNGFSMQIGDPNRIAEITGITTICDFRRRDIANGGQGAPLVPAFHQAIFAKSDNIITVLNIGGIANISILKDNQVFGFDTGPGNAFMDYWCQQHIDKPYDCNGEWGSQGKVNSELLTHLLNDAYFDLPPPKSTGKEYFSPNWLKHKLAAFPDCSPVDVQATLCELTSKSIANAILEHAANSHRILVCGGGAHNHRLMSNLTECLSTPVVSTEAYGIHPDHVEAMAFAWLARQTINHLPGNLCSVTGAKKPAVLGGIYPGHLGIKTQ